MDSELRIAFPVRRLCVVDGTEEVFLSPVERREKKDAGHVVAMALVQPPSEEVWREQRERFDEMDGPGRGAKD